MVSRCVVCGRDTVIAGTINAVTHGVCEGKCQQVYNDWLDLPHPKTDVKEYYLQQLVSQGGKFP